MELWDLLYTSNLLALPVPYIGDLSYWDFRKPTGFGHEGSRDVNAASFGHKKNSTSTPKQVGDRIDALCSEMEKRGFDTFYITEAP